MNNKIYKVRVLGVFMFMAPLCASVRIPPPPSTRSGLKVPKKASSSSNVGIPTKQEQEVTASIKNIVDKADSYISNYMKKSKSEVDNSLSEEPINIKKGVEDNQYKADVTMARNTVIVGDDTVELLGVKDMQDWKTFINNHLVENPQALVESLVPLYQFNPADVKELSEYIAGRKNLLEVRKMLDSKDMVEDLKEVKINNPDNSFYNSPEAQNIRREFKNKFTNLAGKQLNRTLEIAEKEAEKKAESAWYKINSHISGKK